MTLLPQRQPPQDQPQQRRHRPAKSRLNKGDKSMMRWHRGLALSALLLFSGDTSTRSTGGGIVVRADDRDDSSRLSSIEVLLRFYDETLGLRWDNRTNWLVNDDVCQWYGIECYGSDASDRLVGHVRSIDLSDNHLVGTVPHEIFNLPYLQDFEVRDNPDLQIPLENLSSAQYLEKFVVSNTALRDLTGIGALAGALKELHITNLQMEGPMNPEVFQLVHLTGVYANYNQFNHPLPTEIGLLTELTELFLYENQLTGQLPSELGLLENMEILALAQNDFSGFIPEEFNRLTKLKILAMAREDANDVNRPMIGGKVPSFSNLERITELYLENHALTGELPDDFLASAPRAEVVKVDLSHNQIEGSVPQALADIPQLNLYLADNKIDSLSQDFCDLISQTSWMGGLVSTSGCDAFLCPPRKYNQFGRQTADDNGCQDCDQNPPDIYGRSTCDASAGENGGPPLSSERDVLTKLYTVMGGRYWKSDFNWLNPSADVCDWYGIDCRDGSKVTRIDLKNNGVTGTPPPEMWASLTELLQVDFAENSLDFKFDGVGGASKLEFLDLTNTETDSLDNVEDLADTPILVLRLSSNFLLEDIPLGLFDITSLHELYLSHNRMSGPLPPEIGNLNNILIFHCYGNRLSGQLPSELGLLTNAKSLVLSENQFTGFLPDELNKLTDIETISIHQTSFNGGIGGSLPAFEDLKALTELHLDANQFEGELPRNFLENTIRAEERIELYLSDNQFIGGIPDSWANRFDRLVLDLTGNRLTTLDDFPCSQVDGWMDGFVVEFPGNECEAILCPVGTYNEFGRRTDEDNECRVCFDAQYLGAKDCSESGEVNEEVAIMKDLFYSTGGPNWANSSGWKTSTNHCEDWFGIECNSAGEVVRISLGDNGLTGTPTTRIFDLPSLNELDFQDNSISFSFDGIGKAGNLELLYLSETAVSSLEGIGQATRLVTLHLTGNDIEGPLPDELFNLVNLKQLFMNYNSFSGRLPDGVSRLQNLEELYLLHNRLEGQIPAAVGSLKKLRILSLTDNDITGTLPSEVNDMTALEIFAVQRETRADDGTLIPKPAGTSRGGVGLRGPLPSLTGLENIRKLYLGSNGFTGTIPFDFLDGVSDKTADIEVDLIENHITGQLPPSLVQFEQMTLWVAGNELTGIADGLCLKEEWMKGKVADYGCDAILCPRNTFSGYGRQNDEASPCEQCDSDGNAEFYGSFECISEEDQRSKTERAVLVKVYNELDGMHWDVNDGWLAQDVSICNWHGITCVSDTEYVSDIHLVSNSLVGDLPTDLWLLEDLKVLNLAGNKINVSFDGVEQTKLSYLNLDSTGVTDTTGIEAASDTLTVLHAIGNNFGGNFPEGVVDLVNLEVLYLSDNDLGGELPSSLQDLGDLVYFQCNDCGLSGDIPDWFQAFTKLENLGLAQNAFEGPFPDSIKTLTTLRHLDLSDQHRRGGGFTGVLFDFADFTALAELLLNKNEFEGQIPEGFMNDASTENVVTIDLRWNNLNGSIPVGLTRFPSLNIDLADNAISELPPEICAMTSWNDGQLEADSCDFILCDIGTFSDVGRAKTDKPCEACDQENTAKYFGSTLCTENTEKLILNAFFIDLAGGDWTKNDGWLINPDLCTWYGITCFDSGENKGKVQYIELGSNNLVGEVSESIWDLEHVTWLELRGNNITISSFDNIGNAAALETLYLSETLVDSIDGVEQATSLTTLHLTSAKLEGPFPPSLLQMDKLEHLFMNYNNFSGPLPPGIGNLSNLRELFIFHNAMTGTIPTQIGKLVDIEVLALGENQFYGDLPPQLGNLAKMEILSLQQESGSSPTGGGGVGESSGSGMTGKLLSFNGLSNLQELYLGANSFTGSIPSSFLSGVQNKSMAMQIDLTLNQLEGPIPAGLAEFDNMHLYLAGNKISDIPEAIRNKGSWMGGEVENGWDAILCPPGQYNEYGRRVNDDKVCQDCGFPEAVKFYGSVTCDAGNVNLTERQVLREVYQATGGNNWKNRDGWDEDDVDICDWKGIRCEEGQVVTVELADNFLQGDLPPLVWQLPKLKNLDVSENPIDLKFEGIEAAANLVELRLDSTHVTSLKGIGKAIGLRTLNVEQNNFGGELPEEIYDLTQLRYLHLSDSGFSGTLSERFGNMANLRQFFCHGNFISGEIPDSIGQLGDLEHLELSENLLYGTLPQALENLASLKVLDLDSFTRTNVGISGPLLSFSNLPKLRELFLGDNSLTGSIPENFLGGIDDKDAVINVGLKSNQITGEIPGFLSDFSQLNIDLADNKINDIDDDLCDMGDWMNGYVDEFGCDAILCPAGTFNKDGRQSTSENFCVTCDDPGVSPFLGSTSCAGVQREQEKQILELFYQETNGDKWKQNSGWLDDDIDMCQWYGVSCRDGLFVESILLGSNNLSGKPPQNLFDLENLEFLWLYSNPIEFSFTGIKKATTLKSLLLDSTGLNSLEGIGEGAALVDVDVRFNNMEGSIPSEIRNLHNLESFLAGNNKLTGTVPSFATNRRLRTLRMGDNLLTGTVPSFNTQFGMNALDLSGNRLEGKIPTNLFQAADESGSIFLDLSSNSLTGTVPGELARFVDASIYLKDNKISGINQDLCSKEKFNDGDVGAFSCNGILCPSGTYGPVNGRATQDGDGCLPCDKSDYFGASVCGEKGKESTAARLHCGTMGAVLILCATVLYMLV